MKTLRALLLVSALSIYGYAGEMDNGRTEPPPPPPTTAGNMDNGASVPTDAPITEAILSLLESVLSAF